MRESLVRKSDVSSSTPIHAVTEASLPQVLDGLGSAALNWCKVNDLQASPQHPCLSREQTVPRYCSA